MADPLDTDLTETARARLVNKLLADGAITSPAVEAAFRRVPRHLFTPSGVSVEAAYADDVVVTRRGPDGKATSSISAPWLQAAMLHAAHLQPGVSRLTRCPATDVLTAGTSSWWWSKRLTAGGRSQARDPWPVPSKSRLVRQPPFVIMVGVRG